MLCIQTVLGEAGCGGTPLNKPLIGWGTLVFQGGYFPLKTKHVIRVVFQDQAVYAYIIRSAKTFKMGKKVCFWQWS